MVYSQWNNQRLLYRHQFAKLRRRGLIRSIWSKMTGQPFILAGLNSIAETIGISARNHAGILSVPIHKIVGSEGRTIDFDREFLPLQNHNLERWVSIATAMANNVALPLVELIQIGDLYFVRDGHHRISVARWFGQVEMEAKVTVWRTEHTLAEIHALILTEHRTPVRSWVQQVLAFARSLISQVMRSNRRGLTLPGTPATQVG